MLSAECDLSGVESDLYSGLLETTASEMPAPEAYEFLLALSQTDRFDMNVMMATAQDNQAVRIRFGCFELEMTMHSDVALSLLLTGRDHCYWNERGRIHRERLFHVEEALWFINEI